MLRLLLLLCHFQIGIAETQYVGGWVYTDADGKVDEDTRKLTGHLCDQEINGLSVDQLVHKMAENFKAFYKEKEQIFDELQMSYDETTMDDDVITLPEDEQELTTTEFKQLEKTTGLDDVTSAPSFMGNKPGRAEGKIGTTKEHILDEPVTDGDVITTTEFKQPTETTGLVDVTSASSFMENKAGKDEGKNEDCWDCCVEKSRSANGTGDTVTIASPFSNPDEIACDCSGDEHWLIIQRRTDGSVNFNRTWEDYVAGFGSAKGEYWLGLERMHNLTKNHEYKLKINLMDHNDTEYYATYSDFVIGGAVTNYILEELGNYSGNIENSLSFSNGMQFSASPFDNDISKNKTCYQLLQSGWWFRGCGKTNLNGIYHNEEKFINRGLRWWTDKNKFSYSFKRSIMKITCKNKAKRGN